MVSIDSLLAELDEVKITQKIGTRHDEARNRYFLISNTVRDGREFNRIITEYYALHSAACFSNGAMLPDHLAFAKAQEILEQEYRRHGGTINAAYDSGITGLNGGMRTILDIIAEALKAEDVEAYFIHVFRCYVDPGSWEEKVDIIRQFMARCGAYLPYSIRTQPPERYANHYEELIRGYIASMRKTSDVFRRL